ncbi:aminoacetone oxidase family FAD-binding enzyme [Niveispirillum lacus]|uniref:Aminoacetone oxidase family FAD-binding enzyme n=1 Tax=Niveispirillum lacus TaxID=1981099 RepID=A0A255YYE6_9PROT|nr:TIGR03862 family flavoprotein [Niveispirillum lacus]OYQ33704.1 aminoacetone oxidase family FAD-binding enzyme [Niveispirillum lacus]
MTRPILIIGAGPAGLMAAEILAGAGYGVEIHDAMPSPARKFLMAGRGGLNITHSEPLDRFITRYGAARPFMDPLIRAFPPLALRDWCQGLGVETFVGSSGRVFPNSFKASILLRAWLKRLEGLGVRLFTRHRWAGWAADGAVLFDTPTGRVGLHSAATLLAMGGASWPRLGSDGGWAPLLAARGVPLAPFRPSNSGFDVAWSPGFLERAEGQPLKRIALTFQDRTVPGELVVTRTGLEGGALYALSAPLREALERDGRATLAMDLKPDLTLPQVQNKLARTPPADSLANRLRKGLALGPPIGALIRECAGDADLGRTAALAALIKALPVTLSGQRGLDRAISSAGGIKLSALDSNLMISAVPGTFACGEMLDWEAPTGGYLLQACYATAIAAAKGVARFLSHPSGDGGNPG